MSVAVDIVPLAKSLDMYGEPSSHSAFSLSGHVSISLSSLYSVFERRRAARVLLQSVLLTFDGQSEVITNALGYSPLRLCSISRELLSSGPLELTNAGQEDDDEPAQWNIVFDLPIPGWLPASHDFAPGDLGASTQYCLHAVVKFVVLEDLDSTSWSLTSLYSSFRSRAKTLKACQTVTVRRFVEPPTDEPTTPTCFVNYLLSPPTQTLDTAHSTLPHILSKIQVVVSVPKYVDVCDSSLSFTLRLRTKDLEEADCKRLQVTKFTVDVAQEERCRRVTNPTEFRTRYPIAPAELQPPNKCLLNRHAVADMYEVGMYVSPPANAARMLASSSMLPAGESGVYRLTGDTHIFAEDTAKDSATWYTLETLIPFTHDLRSTEGGNDWEGARTVRPSTTGPLYEVAHVLKLSVTCVYSVPDSDESVSSDLVFYVPLTFGRIAPPLPPRDLLPALVTMLHLPDGAFPPISALLPDGAGLPVYSQLFDDEGNRKVDDTPLPLYTPRGHTSSDAHVDAHIDAPIDLLPPFNVNEKQHHVEPDATSF